MGYIYNLRDRKRSAHIGNKAQWLRFLIQKKFAVPNTWVCTWDAFLEFRNGSSQVLRRVAEELSAQADMSRSYAVRSSANVEDSENLSFAGQFKSLLHVQGLDAIIRAIETVWTSATAPAVQCYGQKMLQDPDCIKMAVIIQEMIQPAFSGVAFSRNPITGMDETVVEAVRGTSDVLLQEGITPCRWIYKWGEWIALPQHEDVPREIIREVVTGTREIAKTFGRPVDVEWAYADSQLYWVQLREITSLKSLNVYSNHIAKEVLPGIIKPLVWSVNVPMVNSAWKTFLSELVGKLAVDHHALARCFYYRAYFNMGVIGNIFAALGLPPETIELLMGIYLEGAEKPSFKLTPRMLVRLPRIVKFCLAKILFTKKFPELFSTLRQDYQAFQRGDIATLSMSALLHEIDRLYQVSQRTAYYNIIAQLLMGLFNTVLKAQLKKLGVDFACFDLAWDMEDLKRFDPTIHILALQQQVQQLPEETRHRMQTASYDEFTRLPGTEYLQNEVAHFFDRFGHVSDSGCDFSAVPWRETPEVIMRMITGSPQQENPELNIFCFDEVRMSHLRRWLLRPLYERARTYWLYREEISFLFSYGYGLLRTYFMALGERCVQQGLISVADDIFYLSWDELRAMIERHDTARDYAAMIAASFMEITRLP